MLPAQGGQRSRSCHGCSCLSENASIRAERFHNPFYPRAAWGLWRSGGTACEAARCAPGFQAPTRRASGVLGPTHRSPRQYVVPWRKTGTHSTGETSKRSPQWRVLNPESGDPVENLTGRMRACFSPGDQHMPWGPMRRPKYTTSTTCGRLEARGTPRCLTKPCLQTAIKAPGSARIERIVEALCTDRGILAQA